MKLSEHDKGFLRYQAQSDFCTNAPAVMLTIKARYATTALSALCVEMSYISFLHSEEVAPTMSLHLASSYQWQDADEKRDAEDMLRRVRSLDGDNLLVRVIVREGSWMQPFMIICPVPAVVL